MGANISKSISKNANITFSQKRIDNAKHSATNALKAALKRANQKTTEATDDLIGNKIVGKITVSQKLHKRITQKQMKKKYLEECRYLQNKDRKLLII